jgi:hypothetical protein
MRVLYDDPKLLGDQMEQKQSQSELLELGEKLERQSVQCLQDKNWDALEKMLDPACQFVGMDGACDRTSAIALMKGMNLGPVQLKDFLVTQSGDNLIVSFWLAADEYHDGKALSSEFSPRLSVWKNKGDQWLCIAYADFITPKS